MRHVAAAAIPAGAGRRRGGAGGAPRAGVQARTHNAALRGARVGAQHDAALRVGERGGRRRAREHVHVELHPAAARARTSYTTPQMVVPVLCALGSLEAGEPAVRAAFLRGGRRAPYVKAGTAWQAGRGTRGTHRNAKSKSKPPSGRPSTAGGAGAARGAA